MSDADSSQTLVVLDTNDGRSLAVQGPPGTGKSQTITNIIACALANGKTVLFVAEKMAALNVVERRLNKAGLGDGCLQLHSFKARKTHVMESIRNTLAAARPLRPDLRNGTERVQELRRKLNEFAFAMNTPLVDGGISPHSAVGIMQKNRARAASMPGLRVPAAPAWTVTEFDENRALADLLSRHLRTVGLPSEHPWKGVCVEVLLPSDRPEVEAATAQLLSAVKVLLETLRRASDDLGLEQPGTLQGAELMSNLCDLLSKQPKSDPRGVADAVWQADFEGIRSLIECGHEWRAVRDLLLESVRPDAMDEDFASAHRAYKVYSASLCRWVHGDYRRARRLLKNACAPGRSPRSHSEAIDLMAQLCRHRELRLSIEERQPLGEEAFGDRWVGTGSDWCELGRIVKWMAGVVGLMERASASPALLTRWEEMGVQRHAEHHSAIEEATGTVTRHLNGWIESLRFDCIEAFGVDVPHVPLESWVGRLDDAGKRTGAVFEWIGYRRHCRVCCQHGMDALVASVDAGELCADSVLPRFEYSYGEEVLRRALSEQQVLRDFSRENHEHLIDHFCELDRRLIEATRQYLAAKLWDRMPHPTTGDPASGSMSYLTSQLRRKRGIPPVRELMSRAGDVITRIKPCFMMSPMSVAQFLPPGAVSFDMLVVDEASQMKPEDALGVIARCKQCVIVGDTKQLPPTGFFDSLVGGDDDDDSDLADVESILEAGLIPLGGGRTLRWHYRSKHESLIAFSNKEFYDSKLYVFPSPSHRRSDLGVVSHYVPDGVYARGGSRKNLVEAEVVANAVFEHARKYGDLSLGVVALSKAQQQAIQDKLEELRRKQPEMEWFFSPDRDERFWVWNLETVQGDERDVMYISVGYGKDQHGYPHMNFGPVNREGGWRRLNVLITRARCRCEVFHSLRADEIRVDDLTESERPGLRGRIALRNYLAYAETGQLDQPEGWSEDLAESPFEEAVAEELERLGIEVHRQVGVASFRIDLAVVDPANPGRYVLGVECDGRTYHSAKSARDRDRLRQEVLESLGWRIHRIWSLDWLRDQDKELRRVLIAIEEAKNDPLESVTPPHPQREASLPVVPVHIVRTAETKDPKSPHELVKSVPYTKAAVRSPCSWYPEFPPIKAIADVIAQVVEVESPIHSGELVKRVAEIWGFGRTGSRIAAAVRQGLGLATQSHRVICRDPFVWSPSMSKPPVRNRGELGAHIDTVTPEEIRAAAEEIQRVTLGLTGDALIMEVARCLGYARTGHQVQERIRQALCSGPAQ